MGRCCMPPAGRPMLPMPPPGRAAGIDGRAAGIEGRAAGIEGRAAGIDGRAAGIEGRAMPPPPPPRNPPPPPPPRKPPPPPRPAKQGEVLINKARESVSQRLWFKMFKLPPGDCEKGARAR